MTEALGDADSDDDLIEDDEFDDLDDFDGAAPPTDSGLGATLTSPAALAIAALVLATVSLIGLLSSYSLVNAFALTHQTTNPAFGPRVSAAVELGLGLLAILFAALAHSASRHELDQPSQRVPRAIAGAAFLLALVSIAESGGALLIMIGAHTPVTGG
jgi:hypothetical protein